MRAMKVGLLAFVLAACGSQAGAATISVGGSAPTGFLIGTEQGTGNAGIIRFASGGGTTDRVIGQSFQLSTASTVTDIVVRGRDARDYTGGVTPDQLQLAIMEDTDSNNLADALVAGGQSFYSVASLSYVAGDYITMPLDNPLNLDGNKTYHFEIWWTGENNNNDFSIRRSGNNAGSYADGQFVNATNAAITSFPAGEILGPNQNRDLTFYVLGTVIPEPSGAALLGLGAFALLARRRR